MAKVRQLSFEESLVDILRESSLSCREIVRHNGCHHSTALRIHKQIVSAGLVAKQDRPGRPNKFDERGERKICRAGRRLRFSTVVSSDLDLACDGPIFTEVPENCVKSETFPINTSFRAFKYAFFRYPGRAAILAKVVQYVCEESVFAYI